MQSVGYRELFAVEEGRCSFESAVELVKRNSRRYAKRQCTWFSKLTNSKAFEAAVSWKELQEFFLREAKNGDE
jgi:tRNA dimethylallyltransferase